VCFWRGICRRLHRPRPPTTTTGQRPAALRIVAVGEVGPYSNLAYAAGRRETMTCTVPVHRRSGCCSTGPEATQILGKGNHQRAARLHADDGACGRCVASSLSAKRTSRMSNGWQKISYTHGVVFAACEVSAHGTCGSLMLQVGSLRCVGVGVRGARWQLGMLVAPRRHYFRWWVQSVQRIRHGLTGACLNEEPTKRWPIYRNEVAAI